MDLDRLDLDEVRLFFARRWRLIGGVALSCAVLAAVVCLALTPTFTATAQILLDPRKQHIFGSDGASPDASLDSSIVDSQIPVILSTRLLAKVVTKENLASDPEFAAAARLGVLSRLSALFRPAKAGMADQPTLEGIDPKLAPVILNLFNKIDVVRVSKSFVLSLSVSSREPGKATRLANTLAQTFVEDQIDVRAKSVQQAATFFEARLGSLRDQVRQSEQAVADYRRQHDFISATTDGKVTVGEQQLQSLNERLAAASADTAQKLATTQQAARFRSSGTDYDTLPEIVRSPVITQLRGQQADLARREAELMVVYEPGFPAIAQIRAQRAGLARALQAEMKRLVSLTHNDYEVAKAREDSLRRSVVGLGDTSGGDNATGVKLRELERTNLANKALFENFLSRAKLTQEQSTFEEPDARVISPALEPSAPSAPKTKLIVVVAGLAGLLAGLASAAGLDRLGQSGGFVRRPRSAPIAGREGADAFILGRVPEIIGAAGADVDCLAFLEEHPGSAFARAIATIAEQLTGGVTLLTPLGDEGATTLTLCLAAAAGRAGRRVLVIDADGARRGLSLASGLAAHEGLAEALGRGDGAMGALAVGRTPFAVLPAGRGSLDLVSGRNLQVVLAEAARAFDLVLIDGPSFIADPGARALASEVDAVVLVAAWEQLMRRTFVSAIDAVSERANFAGIILNRAVAKDRDSFAMAG